MCIKAGGTAEIKLDSRPEYLRDGIFLSKINLVFFSGKFKIPLPEEIKKERGIFMEYITGIKKKPYSTIEEVLKENRRKKETFPDEPETIKTVQMEGTVHTVRNMGEVAFIILRRAEGLVQCVYETGKIDIPLSSIREECAVRIRGMVQKETRAPHGFEIRLCEITVLSSPAEPLPIPISKQKMTASLETKLSMRPISLRNIRERAKFKIQEGLVRGFREFLSSQGFTEIHTPKIVSRGAEGGANVFRLEYFGKHAELAQSPQFYKQMMVGVFDRVFETAPVFRAEKHNTTRHLNEYMGLDYEMGYIDSFEEIMAMETGYLQYTMELLRKDYAKELEILDVKIPDVTKIPKVRFDEAKVMVSEKYDRKIRNPYDLEPEEEALIGRYFKEECGADFVFVTHYPSKKRPVYAMDDPADPNFTLSFDLLFKGVEITTGGQRIHDYHAFLEKMKRRGMSPDGMDDYLSIFKYGMPPHGGLGIGLERLTMKLLDEQNVRETSLFPRDVTRLEP